MKKLYMILLGCKPSGRNTEQHDIFFGIGENLASLKTDMIQSWPEANGKMHVDVWREVTVVNGFSITVKERTEAAPLSPLRLFFLNLGGYKPGDFEEYHYKMLAVAADKADAVKQAKGTAFYKHTGFEGANSHIDDKYGVDVDDIFEIEDILPPEMKEKYRLHISVLSGESKEDAFHAGYLKMEKI